MSLIYIKLTSPSGGVTFRWHQIWDAALFLASQIKQHSDVTLKPGERRTVSIATEAEYMQSRKDNK